MSFVLPGTIAATGHRRTAYVSPLSSTLNYSATNGAATLSGTAIPLAGLCTPSGASRACTVPITAPIGSDTFTISLYQGASLLSTHTTTVGVPIAEGAANVVPPLVLDPVAASMALLFGGAPSGTTAAQGVMLAASDAAAQPIVPPGTYVSDTSDAPATLTLTALTTTAGSFSANACSSQTTSFPGWTTTSSLAFCPTNAKTLGTLYAATLGAISAPFATRRTNVTGASTATALSGSSNYITAQWISGSDASRHFGFGSNGYAYVGNYSTTWASCAGGSAPVLIAKNGTTVFAVLQGFAQYRTYVFNAGLNTCTIGASYLTGSDIVAMINDPVATSSQVYAVSSDFSSVRVLHSINANTNAKADSPVNCGPQTSNNATYPTSLAVGPGNLLYVGCYNGLSVSTYQAPFAGTMAPTPLAVGSSGTGLWVAANQDVAYAVETGAAQLIVHTLATTSPLMRAATYTFATSDTLATGLDMVNQFVGNPLVVANDDRLYLVVGSGVANRIVAYDPYSGTLTDPALTLAANVSSSTLQNVLLSLAPNGKLLVGGYDTSNNVLGAFTWPN